MFGESGSRELSRWGVRELPDDEAIEFPGRPWIVQLVLKPVRGAEQLARGLVEPLRKRVNRLQEPKLLP